MIWLRGLCMALLATGGWALVPDSSPVHAGCVVETSGTYVEGTNIRDDKCDTSANKKVTLGTLLSGEDTTNNLIRTSGGAVRTTAIMTDVTTNTASATQALFTGNKTFTANVDCTGACTATVTIYGDITSTAETLHTLCVLVLDATTRGSKYCNLATPTVFPYAHAVTTSVTGTGAAVDVNVHY